ncbi:MAG TPA: prepilin-type N-terminal cleavage/methylation domain-containing protein [Mycobacteriales bacterium]|nr:prepilin-type N-terminal cleavage/methylation domain-containing protein [Mycobacteriales bacterium]
MGQRDERDRGFTLVEMLVVLVILAVLSAIVAMAVGGITDHGDAAACEADVKTLAAAQEAHYAKHRPGSYAASAAALVSAGLIREEPTHRRAITTDATGNVYVDGTPVGGSSPDALCA